MINRTIITDDVTSITDDVTSFESIGDWKTGEWSSYSVPAIPGHTPSQAQLDPTTVDCETEDQVVNINYVAKPQVAKVNFIDQTTSQTIQSIDLNGSSDSSIDFSTADNQLSAFLNQGYALATNNDDLTDGKLTLTNFDHDDQIDQSFNVYLVHQTSEATENKIITRTINVHMPDGTTNTIEQPVTLNRTVMIDQVTGDQTFGDWTTGSWDDYQVPTVDGYTPSQASVDQADVDGKTTDPTIDITYQPDSQVAKVNFVDQTIGQTIQSIDLNGSSDETIDFSSANDQISQYLNQGYVLATDNNDLTNGKLITVNYDHNDQTDQSFNVYLIHQTKQTTESKAVTRTINIHMPDGTTNTIEQPVNLTRTVTTDQVTGNQTFGDWSNGSWDAYQVPTVAGYTPSQASVDQTNVDGDTAGQTVDVSYQADQQVAKVNFIDQTTGQTVQSIDLNGSSDSEIDFTNADSQLNDLLSQGYALATNHDDLTDGKLTSANYDHDDQTDQSFNVYLVHQTNETTETKTVSRAINVHMPDGTTTTVEQPVTLSRTVTTDQVTGDQTYGEWSTGSWDTYQVPTVKGYTSSQTSLNQTSVDSDTTDQTVDITYQADPQTTAVVIVDK